MKISAVIPARYASTRFEGKALADIMGKPMVQHVYERTARAKLVSEVIVATDDERIAAAAARAGAEAIMTGPAATGTDRVAEAVRKLQPRPTLVVNVQGDEALIEPEAIEILIRTMDESGAEMGSLMRPIDPEEVAKNLTKNQAYPIDLDATWEDGKLRFCVVMYRNPKA